MSLIRSLMFVNFPSKPWNVCNVSLIVWLVLLNSSLVMVEDYYGDDPLLQQMDEEVTDNQSEVMLNDDIIVSRAKRDCVDDMVECNHNHTKEMLIYPSAQYTTRKMPISRTLTTARPVVTAKGSRRPGGSNCRYADGENCLEYSGNGGDTNEDDDDDGGDEEEDDEDTEENNENININNPRDRDEEWNLPPHQKNRTPPGRQQPIGASSKSPAAQHHATRQQGQHRQSTVSSSNKADGENQQRRGQATSTLVQPSLASLASTNQHHQANAKSSQDVSSQSLKERTIPNLAIHMNIILIAGIAAGIVVLLFILVVAACKFYASSTAPAGAKALTDYHHQQRSANKAAYAYEACNTGGKCSSPLLVPSSQQSLPALSTTPQAGLASVGSATSTVSKPAKKDVKEWYV